jgi:hypothetical protein
VLPTAVSATVGTGGASPQADVAAALARARVWRGRFVQSVLFSVYFAALSFAYEPAPCEPC